MASNSPYDLALEEVWEQIFLYLNPLDIYHCMQACQDWKNLIAGNESKKMVLLLRCVYPHIEKHIQWNDKLNLRAVNKQVNASITKQLVKCPEWNPLPTSYSMWVKHRKLEFNIPQICNGTIFPNQSFEQTYSNGRMNSNPFPNRTLIIHPHTFQTRSRGEVNPYPEMCVQYGSHVWHLAYFLRNDESQPISEFYDVLTYFPSLQSLIVVNDMNVDDNVDGFIQKELPKLENLKTLRFLYYSGGAHRPAIYTHYQECAIYKHLLLAYGSQLETLEGDLPIFEKTIFAQSGKLTALKVGGVCNMELKCIQENMGNLRLSRLSIMVKFPNPTSHTEWRLWLLLKQFCGTLQEVTLMRGPCYYYNDLVNPEYDDQLQDWLLTRDQEEWTLGSVTKLGLSVTSFSKPFLKLILQKCPALEHLTTYHFSANSYCTDAQFLIDRDDPRPYSHDTISEGKVRRLKALMSRNVRWMWEHVPPSVRIVVGVNVYILGVSHIMKRDSLGVYEDEDGNEDESSDGSDISYDWGSDLEESSDSN